MNRCFDLQKQLYQLSLNILSKSKKFHQVSTEELLNTMQPPDPSQELGLRQVSSLNLSFSYDQVLLTGLSDSIARRAPLGAIEIVDGMSRRKRLTGNSTISL
jgi:hypothetical protein